MHGSSYPRVANFYGYPDSSSKKYQGVFVGLLQRIGLI